MPHSSHLGNDDLDNLLAQELGLAGDSSAAPQARSHLQSCPTCREQWDGLRQLATQLRVLRPSEPAAPLDACPQEDVWLLLAASLLPAARSEALLDHAADCDACSLQLHRALSDLADPATLDEAATLAAQPASSPHWSTRFAAELQRHYTPPAISSFWRRFAAFEFYAWAVASVGLVVAVLWITLPVGHRTDPDSLIADAYAEKRTIEPRILFAPWAPLHIERGNDLAAFRMGRRALLHAETEISYKLQLNPDDVRWLNASGAASMLENTEDSVNTAVTTLERAHRLDPTNSVVSTNLASAYLLRSQFYNRPEDAALAVDILSQIYASNADDEVADFNYALALEKLQLKQRALDQWNRYLKRFPDSDWVREAQQHRDALQAQVTGRLSRGTGPLLDPAAFVRAATSSNPASVEAVDSRIEEYRDLALSQWLPRALSVPSRASPEANALDALAQLLAARHSDPWLRDLLSSLRSSPPATPAFRSLAHAAATVETADDAIARASAEQALDGFNRAGIIAGRLQAELILIHLDQYAHRQAQCSTRAASVLANTATASYPSLRIDALLESAICSSVSSNTALANIESARSLADASSYPAVLLRARTAEIGLRGALGDEHAVWIASTEALTAWWNSSAPLIRGYNLLVGTYENYSSRPRWFIQTELLSEASVLLRNDPRLGMVAALDASLGLAHVHTGDIISASTDFNKAAQLLARTPPGPERDYLASEVELGLARVDLADNRPRAAVARLERIRANFLATGHSGLILDFYEVSSTAYLRSGQSDRATADLHAGIALDQASLRQIAAEGPRTGWNSLHEPLYRSLVELELRTDPARAFADWQDFKGAVFRVSLRPVPPASASLAPGTAIISYFQMPAGIYIWVRTGSRVSGHLVPIADSNLTIAAANLIERCSDPNTPSDAWRPFAADLYNTLIAPVEPALADVSRVVIEPDGPLKSLPFALLLDAHGALLADRFALSISPGLDYLRAARPWTGVTSASRALIVGSPSVAGWAPLPEVATEVRAVAASFQHPDLIADSTQNRTRFARQLDAAQVFHFSGHAQASVHAVGFVQNSSASADSLPLESLRSGQLVVLSACSTAQGATGLFDDVDSPVHRLLASRVPTVVASRWNVDSEATAQLMQAFYAALLRGAEPAEALRSAARTVRSQSLYSHPYYWASFAVYGRG